MARRGLLMCVCQGTCPSFQSMDIFEVLNRLRRERVFDWVALHPQLCSDDGDVYLAELLRGAELEQLVVAGCDPAMQRKLFRSAFEAANFAADKHVGVDIRNMNTDQAVQAIKDAAGAA
jgi:heterodisulfide reductase subunit A-like polyferredoxin